MFTLLANSGLLFAYNFMSGDLCYNILSGKTNEVEVTYMNNLYYKNDVAYYGLTSVIIPSEVTYNNTTYSVTSIGDCAFSHCSIIRHYSQYNNFNATSCLLCNQR